jgi:CRP-like cAMP-binding protein
LLASLPGNHWAAIERRIRRVDLVARALIFDVDKPIKEIYFPEDAVISIVGVLADGSAIETATIGREGMAGLPVFLGTDRMSAQAFVQVAGQALVMGVDDFRQALHESESFTRNMQHYTQAFLMLVSQSSACNRAHLMVQRCARWLLHTADRVGRDNFFLTHQFLSQMLGVRRATVTETMLVLQRSGAVTYEMGKVTIRDKNSLLAQSCECYAIITREFDRLLGTSWAPTQASPLAHLKTSDHGVSIVGDGEEAADVR